MHADLSPIEDFVAAYHPFSTLPPESIRRLASQISILYRRAGNHGEFLDPDNPRLYIIRKGAIEIRTVEDTLIDRLDAGACFGFPYLLTGTISGNQISALEDLLLYALPAEIFHEIRRDHPKFDQFFNQSLAGQFSLSEPDGSHAHVAQRIREVMTTNLVCVQETDSIRDTARRMTEASVSCALIKYDNALVGIVTDKDLRARLIAKNGDSGKPVSSIMTASPLTASSDLFLHEAGLIMLNHNVHHLPIVDDGRLVGFLSATDLLRLRNNHPLYLVSKIAKAASVEALIELASQTQQLLFQLIRADFTAETIGQIFTGINDALTRRLITLAEETIGKSAVDYCWVSFGSQARMEQHAGSDQDNGIIFTPLGGTGDNEGAQLHLLKLAGFVCEGLARCGFPLCPGDIMASNPRWCVSLDDWQTAFSHWISQPDGEALLNGSIFFDIRGIAGDLHLARELQSRVLAAVHNREIFLGLLTQTANQRTTPLGFFNNLIVNRSGKNERSLDLKHQGLSLVADIARIRALGAGLKQTGTAARLRACAEAGALDIEEVANLLDAFEFICHLRLRKQLQQLEAGQAPDNHLDPMLLSSLQRNHLKAVFKLIDRSQKALANRFTRGMS